jgi:asparagine synthase (glutamine-hydrolysing)
MIQPAMPAAARVRWQHTGLPISVPYAFSWLSMATQRGIELACGKLGRRPPWSGREASDFPGWFRGSLREFVEETLLAPVTLDRGIFNPDAVRRVVEEHLRTSADHSQLLGILLSTELFCRLFIDDLTSSLSRWTRPVESMPLLAGG